MNKKMFLTLTLILVLGIGAFAQNYAILVQPVGSKDWGYADNKGNMIIDAKYRKCIGFSDDGFAAIYDGKAKQFFFINLKGETLQTEIKDFKLIEIFGFGMKGFSDGFAPVEVNDKWGFLNTDGKLAIQTKYDKVVPFRDGFSAVKRNGQFYSLDKSGNEFLVDVPGIVDLNDFSEKLASFRASDDLVGFVDGGGKVVIQPKFKAAGDFYGGLAWAKNNSDKVGYINSKGEWVLEPQFDSGKNFDPESGLARVKTGDKWAYVSKTGDIMYMNDSDLFEDFSNGLARGKKNDKFGFFNDKMEWAIKPQYDGARDFKNGYAAVKSGERWGVVDHTGNVVIEPKFENIKDMERVK